MQQEADQPAVGRLVGGGDHGLKEVVGLLELVAELQVGLGELELVTLRRFMAATRSMFSPANIQQRPLCFWLVTSGVLMTCEKVRCSARTTASRLRATTCTLPAVTAFSARRLRGSAAKVSS